MFIATILAGLRTANNVSSKGIALISVAAVVTVAYKCNFFKAHGNYSRLWAQLTFSQSNRLKGMELVKTLESKALQTCGEYGRKDEDASAEGESGITDKPHEYTELKSEEFLRNSLTVRKKFHSKTFIVNAALAALFGFQTAQTLDDLILETKSKAVRTPPPKPIKSLPPLTKAYSTTITYGSFPTIQLCWVQKPITTYIHLFHLRTTRYRRPLTLIN
ncbi:hypothetical protein BC829DRAFT_416673 [Chytridium lagenaria]|nr:hypothetical protein BC829DRAFT_416673 [Chytridium lagenaria]